MILARVWQSQDAFLLCDAITMFEKNLYMHLPWFIVGNWHAMFLCQITLGAFQDILFTKSNL